jgi:hypothetical protein
MRSVRASINCALTRTLLAARCTLPSTTWATPNSSPIFRWLRATPLLYCITEVRLITLRSAICERSVRIWSCTPSVKNSFCFSSLRFSNGKTAMLFSTAATVPGAADGAGCLRGSTFHHQPTAMINNKRSAIAASTNLRDVDFDRTSVFATGAPGRSHGNTIRNKSMGTEMFFNSVGASFSKRASSVLRICRSTSIETQIPPALANCSMREAMFTPSPYTSPPRWTTSPM